jgi:phosphate transport system substrate-binding protein
MLARRLYFYTAARSSPLTRELITFALSADGQNTARTTGFVDLSVRVQEPDACDKRCSARYAASIKRARRLSLDFRFRSGTKELDSRGTRDLDRVVAFLNGQPGARVLLLGFSDGVGNPAQNLLLSRDRAKAVSDELAARGVHAAQVDGFGAEMAVASNSDESGRERNRRVEVWIAPE